MKKRLDQFITLQENLPLPIAQSLIMTGAVLVDGSPEFKIGRIVNEQNQISLRKEPRQHPSRAADKLLGGLTDFQDFQIIEKIKDRICVDLGASHGGFTSVLLEKGAKKVYSIDVSRGLLDYRLQQDNRVVVLDKHNVRHIDQGWFSNSDFQNQPWFVTSDISFLSIRTIVTELSKFATGANLSFYGIFLLKPQFEASNQTEKGILADPSLRSRIIENTINYCQELGYQVIATADSKLAGRKGNVEVCLFLSFNMPKH
ncbi:MAG: hypothetical protein H3C43_13910 [Leptonema sp. (in: Bacteria)]|nr:hypothetical protein [Leptonema sp. (in: bacteria)]